MELGRHLHANVASTEPDHVKRSGCQPLFRLPSYNELSKRNRKRKHTLSQEKMSSEKSVQTF